MSQTKMKKFKLIIEREMQNKHLDICFFHRQIYLFNFTKFQNKIHATRKSSGFVKLWAGFKSVEKV